MEPRLELSFQKGVFYVVEQPLSSLLFLYRPVRRLLKRHRAQKVVCSLGAYGAPTLKPVTWLHRKIETCFKRPNFHVAQQESEMSLICLGSSFWDSTIPSQTWKESVSSQKVACADFSLTYIAHKKQTPRSPQSKALSVDFYWWGVFPWTSQRGKLPVSSV